jgi:hypothetical protein
LKSQLVLIAVFVLTVGSVGTFVPGPPESVPDAPEFILVAPAVVPDGPESVPGYLWIALT